MLDRSTEARSTLLAEPGVADALARAAGAVARVDQALIGHPLRPAFLYRTRLEAVRRQAGVDGQAIDPWHLAAVLEGLRLRTDHALRTSACGACHWLAGRPRQKVSTFVIGSGRVLAYDLTGNSCR